MKTPSSDFKMLFEIKKSKFVVYIKKVSSNDEAARFIKETGDPQANHNCWAYKISDTCKFSDDGEPSGTAGKPILKAIINNDFNNTVVLVTRYFGGIKLGAGGLIRAYSSVTSDTLKEAPFEIIKDEIVSQLSFQIKFSGKIYHLLKNSNISILEEQQLNLLKVIKFRYEKDLHECLNEKIQAITHGSASLEVLKNI